jgi:large subunit ribosomal protein L33
MVSVQASERGARHYGARVPITLACSECKARNYKTTKGTAISPDDPKQGERAIELKKFCKHCKKHTLHRETK